MMETNKFQIKKNIESIDKKIPDTSNLVTNTAFNSKSGEGENKSPDVSGLVTKTAFNTKTGEVENKIPDHDKCITTAEFSGKIFLVRYYMEN